jgi:hypothetical protein
MSQHCPGLLALMLSVALTMCIVAVIALGPAQRPEVLYHEPTATGTTTLICSLGQQDLLRLSFIVARPLSHPLCHFWGPAVKMTSSKRFSVSIVALVPQWARTTCTSSNGTVFFRGPSLKAPRAGPSLQGNFWF